LRRMAMRLYETKENAYYFDLCITMRAIIYN